jgi:hypothetical protein
LLACKRCVRVLLVLRGVAGVKPNPPKDFRVAGFALDEILLGGDTGFRAGFAKVPSLVFGLLLLLLFLLMADAGRAGGPIGDSMGAKKLDPRLLFGVAGKFCRLSIVRSDREGRPLPLSCGL